MRWWPVAKKAGQYPIPFDKNGDMLRYEKYDAVMVDNSVFAGQLTLGDSARGMSAAYFTANLWRAGIGTRRVFVFISDIPEMFNASQQGLVEGYFTFTKRGQNYGIKMAPRP